MNNKVIIEHDHYIIERTGPSILFTWKSVSHLSIQDMAKGITEFAHCCRTHRPKYTLIDARKLLPDSPGFLWVTGSQQTPGQEEYMQWWTREIAPVYTESGIVSLAVATGNPNAPGELPDNPAGEKFKMGYFCSLDDANNWHS